MSRSTPNTSAQVGFEAVSWDAATFNLPKKMAGHTLRGPEKNRYFAQIVSSLDSAAAPSLTKLNVFNSRFDHEGLLTEINGLLTEINGTLRRLFDATNGLGGPIRMTDANAFVFADIVLRGANGNNLQLTPGQPLAPPTRAAARYLTFAVTARPATIYTGSDEVRNAAQLQSKQWTLGITLPTQPTAAGGTQLHAQLDSAQLLTPTVALVLIEQFNGAPPLIGHASRPTGGFAVEINHERFRRDFMEFYHDCRFRLLKVLMKKEFVGTFVQSAGAIQQELMRIKQVQFDPRTRVPRVLSVEEYHVDFMRRLELHPVEEEYGFDPGVLFWSNLSSGLAEEYEVPPRPANETKEQTLERLRSIKVRAAAFERQNRNVQTQVARARGSIRGTSRAPAFAALPMPGTEGNWDAMAFPEGNTSMVDLPFVSAFSSAPTFRSTTAEEIFAEAEEHVAAYMSVCEDAMRRATGSVVPPTECWGCTHHPKFHANRFHRFAECPNKHDPIVRANKAAALAEFLKNRNCAGQQGQPGTSPSTASINVTQWQADGHPSQKAASLVATIADPSTNATSRRSLYKELLKNSSDFGTDRQTAPPVDLAPAYQALVEESRKKSGENKSDKKRSAGFISFLFFPVFAAAKVFEAIKRQFEAHLGITQSMPHVRLPTGTNRDAVIDVMVDSCAGLNLGKLSYHRSIYEARPDLVHQFAFIKDLDNVKAFDIGGISRDAPALSVTALITYKTPFRINGQQVLVSFALSDGSAANTIVGLPFLRATRCAMFMEENGQDSLVVQKLGQTFKIDYHPPLVGETAPSADSNVQASYGYVPTTETLQARTEEVRQQLAQALCLAKAPVIPGHGPPQFVPATVVEPVHSQE